MRAKVCANATRSFNGACCSIADRKKPRNCCSALTANPALAFQVGARVGSLERGKDADLVLSSGDPLDPRTRIELASVVEAVREGHATVVNSIGAGMLESRALMGFLPALCQHVLGEELALPNIATWWCGQEKPRQTALAQPGWAKGTMVQLVTNSVMASRAGL